MVYEVTTVLACDTGCCLVSHDTELWCTGPGGASVMHHRPMYQLFADEHPRCNRQYRYIPAVVDRLAERLEQAGDRPPILL